MSLLSAGLGVKKVIDWVGIGKKMQGAGELASNVSATAGRFGASIRDRERLELEKENAIENKRQFGIKAEQTDRQIGMQGLDYLSGKVEKAGAMAKSGPSFRDAISRALRG